MGRTADRFELMTSWVLAFAVLVTVTMCLRSLSLQVDAELSAPEGAAAVEASDLATR